MYAQRDLNKKVILDNEFAILCNSPSSLIKNGVLKEEFQQFFSRPLFIIIFKPKILRFHPYSILTR